LDPQASKLLLGCLGPIRRARGHLASFLPRLEHPRLDRATGDAKIGRDLGIRHIGMSLVQRDGVGFELIGVLLLWHGFYSHSPAHYGPDSACPPLRVHPPIRFLGPWPPYSFAYLSGSVAHLDEEQWTPEQVS